MRSRLAFALLLLVAPLTARADPWSVLRGGDAVALLRHARAPGTGDPAGFRLDDCATQRNLSEGGRAQARALGAAFRARGVEVARVLSSAWCRARDTANLLDLGPVGLPGPALDSFFAEGAAARARGRAALEALLASLPRDGRANVMVTHQVNVTALTGLVPAEGEIVVLRLEPGGGWSLAGRATAEAAAR